MDSIEALVANIIGLSEEDKITQLHRLLKQSEDLIQIMSPYLGQYLDQLDCEKHSLGYLFLLKAYLSTPAAKEQAELIPLVVRFIKSCVAEQIRLEPKKFTYVCKTLNCLVVQRQVPIMGIAPLQEAVRKLQTSSGRLTALHSEFLLVCLHAKCYRIGYSTLKEDIFEVDQPRDLFLYCYYGGMICIGQKQFRQAIQLLDIVVTAPTQSLNCIAMEAYKKYILVNLIQNGQFSATFPERASSVAQRSLQHFSQPYLDLATSYGTGKIAELENCVATHREKFESDINLELVNQVISSLYKRNIQRLSLQDIAVQPNTPKKAEMRVHQMIGDGEIFATINQKDGMVCISEESEQCKSYETTESIDSSIKRIMSLAKKLNSVHEVISCDPCRLLIAWGTTIFGIANKCGKFVAADSRSVGYDGKIDDFSLKIHEIATNLMAATAGCTAWSLPIVCDLQAQVGKGKNTTVEYCISYAKWFFSRKDYVADKNIFSQIPQNFDIQNEKCGILFVGFHEGKTQMCYISNDGNKKCVEVVEEPCYLKTGQRASFIGLGSGSDYLYEHISADEMDSIKNGKEDSEFYYKVMVKALRNSALRDPEYTGGFAKVFWITDSCIIEKKEALLSYPLDFKAWVKLIVDTETAAEGDLSKIEAVYDAFLTEFPMCCGYWMKYVHHEACLGTLDKVEEVYERAIKFVAYSVDIWLHYCKFAVLNHRCFEAVLKLAKLKSKSDVSEVGVSKYDANAVRRLFQRGLLHVGTNYVSFLLGNEYIKFEESLGERGHAAVIYKNLLAVPIKDRNSIFKRFQLTKAEWNTFEKTEKFAQRILQFEEAIRTPYFHVSHPDESELAAWRKYLDFIELEGDFAKVILLYERCLTACANYPEFWIRYVGFLENEGRRDIAYDALERVILIFAKRDPDIHLFCAKFYEKNFQFSKARAAYQLVHSEISPGHVEAIIEHARFELRQRDAKKAFSVLEKAIPTGTGKEQAQKIFHSLITDEYEKSNKRSAEFPSSKAKRPKLHAGYG